MTTQPMTADQFSKRLASLCLRSGLAGMPKDEIDQHILLKSALLLIGSSGPLTEKQVNEKLQLWLLQVCKIKFFDHVNLRRSLIDAGYLTRSSDGAEYQVPASDPRPDLFDETVNQVDPIEVIRAARVEQDKRKQEFLARGK